MPPKKIKSTVNASVKRVYPTELTEDQADAIISLHRIRTQKTIAFEDYLREEGFELVRTSQAD